MAAAVARSFATTSAPIAVRSPARAGSRTRATTSSPRSRSRRATAPPTNPPPPVRTTRTDGLRLVDRRVRADRLQPLLDVAEEGRASGAIVGPVVDAEDHVHDRPDRDDVAFRCRHDDRALRDRLHRDD